MKKNKYVAFLEENGIEVPKPKMGRPPKNGTPGLPITVRISQDQADALTEIFGNVREGIQEAVKAFLSEREQ